MRWPKHSRRSARSRSDSTTGARRACSGGPPRVAPRRGARSASGCAPGAPYELVGAGSFAQAHRAQAARAPGRGRARARRRRRQTRVLERLRGQRRARPRARGARRETRAGRGVRCRPRALRRRRRAQQGLALEVRALPAEAALPELLREGARFDAAVVNPPRAGLPPRVREALAGLVTGPLVYVSCEPATLARDLAHLAELGWRTRAARALGPDAAHRPGREPRRAAPRARRPRSCRFTRTRRSSRSRSRPSCRPLPHPEHGDSLLARVRALPGRRARGAARPPRCGHERRVPLRDLSRARRAPRSARSPPRRRSAGISRWCAGRARARAGRARARREGRAHALPAARGGGRPRAARGHARERPHAPDPPPPRLDRRAGARRRAPRPRALEPPSVRARRARPPVPALRERGVRAPGRRRACCASRRRSRPISRACSRGSASMRARSRSARREHPVRCRRWRRPRDPRARALEALRRRLALHAGRRPPGPREPAPAARRLAGRAARPRQRRPAAPHGRRRSRRAPHLAALRAPAHVLGARWSACPDARALAALARGRRDPGPAHAPGRARGSCAEPPALPPRPVPVRFRKRVPDGVARARARRGTESPGAAHDRRGRAPDAPPGARRDRPAPARRARARARRMADARAGGGARALRERRDEARRARRGRARSPRARAGGSARAEPEPGSSSRSNRKPGCTRTPARSRSAERQRLCVERTADAEDRGPARLRGERGRRGRSRRAAARRARFTATRARSGAPRARRWRASSSRERARQERRDREVGVGDELEARERLVARGGRPRDGDPRQLQLRERKQLRRAREHEVERARLGADEPRGRRARVAAACRRTPRPRSARGRARARARGGARGRSGSTNEPVGLCGWITSSARLRRPERRRERVEVDAPARAACRGEERVGHRRERPRAPPGARRAVARARQVHADRPDRRAGGRDARSPRSCPP